MGAYVRRRQGGAPELVCEATGDRLVLHGWYWKNNTSAPVTVVLKASGFYTGIYKK